MATLAPARTSQTPTRRLRFWRPLVYAWFRLFRSDIFISYTRSDRGRHYAHALANALRGRRFEVLMDTFEARQSEETPELLLDRMRCTMQLVVVASPGALRSKEVAREIELFPKQGRSIVLLEFEEGVRAAQWYKLHLSGLPPLPAEDAEAEPKSRGGLQVVACSEGLLSTPAEPTVDLIVNAFRYKRQRLREAVLTGLVSTVTLGLLISAGVLWKERSRIAASLSQEQTTLVNERAARNQFEQETKIRLAAGAANLRDQADKTRAAENKTRVELKQQKAAEIARDDARRQQQEAEQGMRIARARLAATSALESDPVVAYRLAEHVYDHPVGNRTEELEAQDARLVRQAASRARFPYTGQFRGCYLKHDWSQWALLACQNQQEPHQVLKVVNLDTGKVEREFPYSYPLNWDAWIVPEKDSWRVMAEHPDGKEVAIDVIAPTGAQTTIYHDTAKLDYSEFAPRLCGPRRLWVRRNYPGVTLLDVNSGREISVNAGAFCGFVSSRGDGSFVIATAGGIGWFQADGTQLALTRQRDMYCSEDGATRSRWSPDGRFLAVWGNIDKGTPGTLGELGVLDWDKRSFKRITPKEYFQTAYIWQGKHTLIVAGHTQDVADYKIESVDAESLERKPLRTTPNEVRDLAAFPDGSLAAVYDSGVVEAMPPSGDQIVWSGRHPGVGRLVAGAKYLLTFSGSEARQWPLRPAAANWVFRSSPARKYLETTGEPSYTWLAATLSDGTKRSIEVRSVRDGESFEINFPGGHEGCGVAVFSNDGRWLFAICKDAFVVFDTRAWQRQPLLFPAKMEFDWHHIKIDPQRVLFTDGDRGDAYEFDLRGEEPLRRNVSGPEIMDLRFFPPCSWPLYGAHGDTSKRKDGWEPVLPRGPADSRMSECFGSGWIEYSVLRNGTGNNPGSADTELVPSNLQKLRDLYDHMLPRVPDDELQAIIAARD